MKFITKNIGNAPPSLIQHGQIAYSNYENYPDKDSLRSSLRDEQGAICCYCMQRIHEGREYTIIEHFIPQTKHITSPYSQVEHNNFSLKYMNLLASCGEYANNCSNKKANLPFYVDPRNFMIVDQIKYDKGGKISSDNPKIQHDIDILRLNEASLKNGRATIIEVAYKSFKKNKNWTKAMLENEISRLETKKDNSFTPFCSSAIFHLNKKLKQFAN
ncbi:MAG: hypothetical protein ABIQ40_06790 [Bacteroidia bacterium]